MLENCLNFVASRRDVVSFFALLRLECWLAPGGELDSKLLPWSFAAHTHPRGSRPLFFCWVHVRSTGVRKPCGNHKKGSPRPLDAGGEYVSEAPSYKQVVNDAIVSVVHSSSAFV